MVSRRQMQLGAGLIWGSHPPADTGAAVRDGRGRPLAHRRPLSCRRGVNGLSDTKSLCARLGSYEPASAPLHISVKWLFSHGTLAGGTYKTVRAKFWPWLQVKVLKPCEVVPSLLGNGVYRRSLSRHWDTESVNMAHIEQKKLNPGPGFLVTILTTFSAVSPLLGCGAHGRPLSFRRGSPWARLGMECFGIVLLFHCFGVLSRAALRRQTNHTAPRSNLNIYTYI